METLHFDLTKPGKPFKILNATNGGPIYKRHAPDRQYYSNFEAYKAARIPFQRNHDAVHCSIYGGSHCHDISAIFPDMDADPNDPASYDFACTDEAILCALEAGTETFFRLGQSIEHQIKKYFIFPPKDYKKWAVICEHIIRHYNEGWANGFYHNIRYWEIWNEPDLDTPDNPNKRTWGGTPEEFFDLYETAAKHLKSCFPHLHIGGPACCGDHIWAERFLAEMQKRRVPMDFFSWHFYGKHMKDLQISVDCYHDLLVKYGYENAESILNEWNYIRNWDEGYIYSVQAIHGLKGAAFVMSAICLCQQAPLDMLMYYDTRPSLWNGAFDYYTCRPLKGYYPLYWYGQFYDLSHDVKAENTAADIYTLCGVDEQGKITAIVTHYAEDDDTPPKEVALDFGRGGEFEVYCLDETHDGTLAGTTSSLRFTLPLFTTLLIKEI